MPQEVEQTTETVNEYSVLESRLRFGEPLEREAAANLLAAQGVSAIPVLVEALKHDPERFVRLAAATSLYRIEGAPCDALRLPEQAADDDLEFMVRVVRARWRHGTASLFLLHRIESADPREVCCAIRAVVRLLGHQKPHTSEAVELKGYLTKALGSRHREVRLEAVHAMSRVDHPEVLMALTPYLSTLANRSHRGLVIGGLATVLGALLLGYSVEFFRYPNSLVALVLFLLFGGVLALLMGGVRVLIQDVSGSRSELEQTLLACAAQNPGRVAWIRDELQRIASPLAGQSPTSQRHARELLQQVRTQELMRGSLPIAASFPETSFEDLPTPAAAPELAAEAVASAKVC